MKQRVRGAKGETEVTGYVLAGGASTRLGRDKALVEVGGTPMLTRMIELLGGVTKQVKLVAAPGKYSAFGVETIEDQWPGEGPLGGIITALDDAAKSPANSERNLIVSCDMPFLTRGWLAFVFERATKSKEHVVLPHSASGPEPHYDCWQKAAAAQLRSGYNSG